MGIKINEFGDTEVLLIKSDDGSYSLSEDIFKSTHKAKLTELSYNVPPECEHPFLKVKRDFYSPTGLSCGVCSRPLRATSYGPIQED